ncbi:MAG: hypothetical protein OER95_16965 [Acidimicrobiia bacterium]|nr:hypothetical protein [Acidimicrobiia bacterium]
MGGSKSFVGTGVVGLVLALCLALAAPATAGRRGDDRGQRDVIAEAKAICAAPSSDDVRLMEACTLRAETFSVEPGLENNYDEFGVVTYSGNKAAQQETAMARQASSAVLSIDDVVTRFQDDQKDMAAFYLCTYAQKARELGPLFDDDGANLAKRAVDLVLTHKLVTEARAVELGCLA